MAMAAKIPSFAEEEMKINSSLGYPKAYAKLCNNSRNFLNPYVNGPPLYFIPYTLQPQEALRAKELDQLFPIVDSEAVPTANPSSYVNLLWKQLDHLGNAGFDPALFRIDPYGNVIYIHADPTSPLAWDVDHWFPCSRGGKSVPGNLRLLQWQVCQKKKNKLEYLIPWWDLQLGISVNQFLSMFASKNSDFRNRAFAFLFPDGMNQELNALQAVDSHKFPQHFIDMEKQIGLAPAAIVSTQRNSDSSILKPLDVNKTQRPGTPFPGIKKFSSKEVVAPNMAIQKHKSNISKENEDPNMHDFSTNPYLSIIRARDSLKQREEIKRKEAEINQLDDELKETKEKNESERNTLQELEVLLTKKKRRVEKCRKLFEAQSSYRAMLEKMIRDAMHQNVVYKEQIRLNQAAIIALMARLEAQREICDKSENELRKKLKQRDEIEKQTMHPCCGKQARKRSRMDHYSFEVKNEDCTKGWTPLRKELRAFLEEEHKASLNGDEESLIEDETENKCKDLTVGNIVEVGKPYQKFAFVEKKKEKCKDDHGEELLDAKMKKLAVNVNEIGDEEEQMKQIGKDNIDKWLKLMLGNVEDEGSPSSIDSDTKEASGGRKSFDENKRDGHKGLVDKFESSRGFKSVPSSPTMILMRKSVECLGKKPKVADEDENVASTSSVHPFGGKLMKKCSKLLRE